MVVRLVFWGITTKRFQQQSNKQCKIDHIFAPTSFVLWRAQGSFLPRDSYYPHDQPSSCHRRPAVVLSSPYHILAAERSMQIVLTWFVRQDFSLLLIFCIDYSCSGNIGRAGQQGL
uniref:Uncharacterized protein n=1 Tax=Romanomermis culicivorax TaxID=13658 RepID=A0A915K730_ROMCU